MNFIAIERGWIKVLKKYNDFKKNRRIKKVKDADGEPLKRFRFWQYFHRTIFHQKIDGDVYSVDVDLYGKELMGPESALYKNGVRIKESTVPSVYEEPGGFIEVETTTYGVKKINYVTDTDEVQLIPDRHSLEGKRADFDSKFPTASKWVGCIAILILIIGLIIAVPAMIEMITRWDLIADNFGTFTSPFQFPDWLNVTLVILGLAAATERALSLKNHWLIDMETNTFDS